MQIYNKHIKMLSLQVFILFSRWRWEKIKDALQHLCPSDQNLLFEGYIAM